MATFQVTAQFLREQADALRNQNTKLESEIQELRAQESAMSSYYEGEARQKFQAAVQQDLQKMEQFKNTITEYAATLDIAAAKYEKAEAQAADIAGTRNS